MTRRYVVSIFAVLLAAAVVTGCEREGSGGSEAAESESSASEEPSGSSDRVDVPADGKKFKPSVSVEGMPKGAWVCNMNGKVHYAAMEKGEGRCPVCNMKLEKRD